MDPKIVAKGFKFTLDIKDVILLYDSLTGYHENFNIATMVKDSKKRQGLTSRPMDNGTLQSLRRIPLLHSFINLLRWLEEAGYYHNAQYFQFVVKDGKNLIVIRKP